MRLQVVLLDKFLCLKAQMVVRKQAGQNKANLKRWIQWNNRPRLNPITHLLKIKKITKLRKHRCLANAKPKFKMRMKTCIKMTMNSNLRSLNKAKKFRMSFQVIKIWTCQLMKIKRHLLTSTRMTLKAVMMMRTKVASLRKIRLARQVDGAHNS